METHTHINTHTLAVAETGYWNAVKYVQTFPRYEQKTTNVQHYCLLRGGGWVEKGVQEGKWGRIITRIIQ